MTPQVTFKRGGGERQGIQVEGGRYVKSPVFVRSGRRQECGQPQGYWGRGGGIRWDRGASAVPKGPARCRRAAVACMFTSFSVCVFLPMGQAEYGPSGPLLRGLHVPAGMTWSRVSLPSHVSRTVARGGLMPGPLVFSYTVPHPSSKVRAEVWV